jgi:hypothetical protein
MVPTGDVEEKGMLGILYGSSLWKALEAIRCLLCEPSREKFKS